MRAVLSLFIVASCLFLKPLVASEQPAIQNDMSIVMHNGSGTVSVPAIPDPNTQSGILTIANWLISAAQSHDWVIVIGLMLVLAVAGFRWALPKLHNKIGAFFNSDHGKGLLVLICSEIASVSTNLLAHSLSAKALLDGLVIAFFGAGGYSIVKPILEKLFSGNSANTTPDDKQPETKPAPPASPTSPTPPPPLAAAFAAAAMVIAFVGLGLSTAGCNVNCKDPINANNAQCKLEQSTIDCAKSASGISNVSALAAEIFGILVSNGANYMADLVALAAKIGTDGVAFVVCEASAIDAYFIAIAPPTASTAPTAADTLNSKLASKKDQVHTRALEIQKKFAPNTKIVNANKMPVVVR